MLFLSKLLKKFKHALPRGIISYFIHLINRQFRTMGICDLFMVNSKLLGTVLYKHVVRGLKNYMVLMLYLTTLFKYQLAFAERQIGKAMRCRYTQCET